MSLINKGYHITIYTFLSLTGIFDIGQYSLTDSFGKTSLVFLSGQPIFFRGLERKPVWIRIACISAPIRSQTRPLEEMASLTSAWTDQYSLNRSNDLVWGYLFETTKFIHRNAELFCTPKETVAAIDIVVEISGMKSRFVFARIPCSILSGNLKYSSLKFIYLLSQNIQTSS